MLAEREDSLAGIQKKLEKLGISAEDIAGAEKLATHGNFVDFIRQSPLMDVTLEFDRDTSPAREVGLERFPR